jgi:ABC-2 type transport system permease protein
MDGFMVLLRKELREAWRTSRVLIVAAVFLFFGLASPILAKYLPQLIPLATSSGGAQITLPTPTIGDAVDQFLKNLGTAAFAAILLAMGVVAREKERGTAAFVLTKPAGRAAFLAAKFAALALLFLAGLALGAAAMYGYTAWLFATLSVGGFLAACGLLLLALLVYAAVTFLGSTLTGSTSAAAGVGIGAYLVLALLGALPRVAPYTPGGLFAPARDLALGTRPADLATPLVANLILVIIALTFSWLAFRQQELGS